MAWATDNPLSRLPYDITRMIFEVMYNRSIDSLDSWYDCLPLLELDKHWRGIFEEKLFATVIIEVVKEDSAPAVSSNLHTVLWRSFEDYVKSVIVYAPTYPINGEASEPIYKHIQNHIGFWLEMVIVTLSNSNETHWFSPRIAEITEPLFNLLANMRCLLINGFDTREFSFPTYPVLFSYDSVGGDELGRGNIRVDDRTGYIVTHIQQPTNMEEDIVDIYSAHGVGIEYQHQVQLLKFNASTLAKLIRVPLVHGRSVEVVSMDAFISMLENDEVDMITTVVPEASNYVLCMPAIRFVRSNGQLVAFDMFRPVGWPDE